jgi:hypothetical protein
MKSHRFKNQLDSLLHDIFFTVTDGLKLGWIRDKNLQRNTAPQYSALASPKMKTPQGRKPKSTIM